MVNDVASLNNDVCHSFFGTTHIHQKLDFIANFQANDDSIHMLILYGNWDWTKVEQFRVMLLVNMCGVYVKG